MTDRCGTQDPRFHDRQWMLSRYQQHGDMWIALELGCSRKTIREQRQAMGIPSRPAHRPRGAQRLRAVTELDATIARVRERAVDESGNEATRSLLANRVLALATEQDPEAFDDLLVSVAATASLLHHQRQQHRQAA